MNEGLSRELQEIEQELQSSNTSKKIKAIHKVICYMNMGKNVGRFFFPVMKCLELPNQEIKKLVYLYITQYSQELPQEAIMVVNSFVRDARDKRNPVVRAMALRTMGCLRVKDLNEYLIQPLSEAIEDTDPYVQKTAVMTVAKIYELNPDQVEKSGMIDKMQSILQNSKNPVVISNTIISLVEIEKLKKQKIIKPNENLVQVLVNNLADSSEWGQFFVLEILSGFKITDKKLAEFVVDRTLSRLNHINPAVVLTSVKVILKNALILDNTPILEGVCRKLTQPLITLINESNECSWILLKNISLLLDKFPKIFEDVRVFFVKYADPPFIKIEKLKIICKLANEENMKLVINELIEYSYDLDVNFSKQALKIIWELAMDYSMYVDSCINALFNILQMINDNSFADHLLEEITIGLSKIYRKYQNKVVLKTSIDMIALNFDRLKSDQALISFLNIAPDFLDIIKNTEDIMKSLMNNFGEKSTKVQLTILTCVLKIYLEDPRDFQEDILKLLEYATDTVQNPDLRDKAFIYWRLLNLNPTVAKSVMYAEKPSIQFVNKKKQSKDQIDLLFEQLGHISVLKNNPQFGLVKEKAYQEVEKLEEVNLLNFSMDENDKQFEPQELENDGLFQLQIDTEQQNDQIEKPQDDNQENFLDLFTEDNSNKQPQQIQTQDVNNSSPYNQLDFLGMSDQPIIQKQEPVKKVVNEDAFTFDVLNSPAKPPKNQSQNFKSIQGFKIVQNEFKICLNMNEKGQNGKSGLQIVGSLQKQDSLKFHLNVSNFSNQNLKSIDIKLKQNCFGLQLEQQKFDIDLSMGLSKALVVNTIINNDNKCKVPADQDPINFQFVMTTNIDTYEFKLLSSLLPFIDISDWDDIHLAEDFSDEIEYNLSKKGEADLKKIFQQNGFNFLQEKQNDFSQSILKRSSLLCMQYNE